MGRYFWAGFTVGFVGCGAFLMCGNYAGVSVLVLDGLVASAFSGIVFGVIGWGLRP